MILKCRCERRVGEGNEDLGGSERGMDEYMGWFCFRLFIGQLSGVLVSWHTPLYDPDPSQGNRNLDEELTLLWRRQGPGVAGKALKAS